MSRGGARKGAGAPKGPRVGSATSTLQLRLTAEEKAVVQEKAKTAGKSLTAFIKNAIL